MKLKLTGQPVQQKLRKLPVAVLEKVKAELEASERISTPVVVAKNDGCVRICLYLRGLNQNIVADVFPIPHVED